MPVLRAPYFEREVLGAEMLDRLGDALFARPRRRRRCCTTASRRSCRCTTAARELRLDLPFASKGDVSLKKIGLELVVRVDGHKRTIMLPGAMAAYRPTLGDARRGLARGRLHRAGAGPCLTDPLEAVREAERLVREATERAEQIARRDAAARLRRAAGAAPERRRRVPGPRRARPGCVELARSSLPPDLQRQLQQALRELLIALRAVLDYSIDRLEPGPEPPSATVEDIPIA